VRTLKIGGILPHVQLFGGVRRYIEIGNELTRRGHRFTIYHPEGTPPSWIRYEGRVKPLAHLADEPNDIVICGEPTLLHYLDKAPCKKRIFYVVLEGIPAEREIVSSHRYLIMVNSGGLERRLRKRYGITPLDGIGGIRLEQFHPVPEKKGADGRVRILCYGRTSRKRKGTHLVVKAVESLYQKYPHLELLLFDSQTDGKQDSILPALHVKCPYRYIVNLPQEEMAGMYSSADIFVSAEKRAGWSNTTMEAMACGVPVICTKSGTTDFAIHNETALVLPFRSSFFIKRAIKRLMNDETLWCRLSENGRRKAEEFTWKILCDKLERLFYTILSPLLTS
jgi:glycosyltransferase involved in cell wall biosynthesis